jgi:fido (protein-threonine AMPylation protein)
LTNISNRANLKKGKKVTHGKRQLACREVDGLKPSPYLIETARQNIESDITIDEVKYRIGSYYKVKPVKDETDRMEEADKVSARIAGILSEKTFTFSPAEYITIHKRLFEGIYRFTGKIRNYNISKAEEIARHIRKSERTVKTITGNLQQKNLLERCNGKRNGYWLIKGGGK